MRLPGLGGPSLSLDAACASSVYALRLACDYLSNHSADVMLAGAVSGADPFFIHMAFPFSRPSPSRAKAPRWITVPAACLPVKAAAYWCSSA